MLRNLYRAVAADRTTSQRRIAPEHVSRIYGPFFTTKLRRGGLGLGLNIAYNIVYGVLRGKIEVESSLGEGTRFILTLPLRS